MRNYLSLLLTAIVSVMFFSSCEESIIPEPDNRMNLTTITASTNSDGADTKTINDETGKISWTAGDQINVFFGAGKGSKFTTTNSGEVAKFTGSIDVVTGGGENLTDDTYLWGVYPYNESNTCDGKNITLTLPFVQQAKAGAFADDLFPQIAKSQNFYMSFYNLCCCIRFKVTSPDIVKVTLFGNNGEELAGKAVVSMDQYPVAEEIINGSTKLMMEAPDKGYFEPDKYYYFVIFPTEFTKGLTIVYHKKDAQASYSNNNSFKLERSTFSSINNKDENLDFKSTETLDIKVADLKAPWSYKTYNGIEHIYHPNVFTDEEDLILTVDTDVDLTKLMYEDEEGNIDSMEHGINFISYATDNTGALILDKEFNKKMYGNIDLRITGPNTIALSHAFLEYTDIYTNYKFRFTLVNPETGKYYNAGFNVELGPKPADKLIDLGHLITEGSLSRDIILHVEPTSQVLQIDGDYYSDIIPNPENLQEYLDIFTHGWRQENNISRPEGIELLQPGYNAVRDQTGNIIGWHDTGRIVIHSPQAYETAYSLQHTYSFYGINYTFVGMIKLIKPNFNIRTNPMFVNDQNHVVLEGKGKLPSFENGEMIDPEEYHVRTNLRDMVIVDGLNLNNYSEVEIIYELKDIIIDPFGQQHPLDHIHFMPVKPAYYMKTDDTGKPYLVNEPNDMDWFGFEQPYYGHRPNNISIEYKLVSRQNHNFVFGSQTIGFSTPGNLVKFQARKDMFTAKFIEGDNPRVNIASALDIFDINASKAIYNRKATSLYDLFDYRDGNGITHGNAYNIYDIRFKVQESKVKMYLESSNTDISGQIGCSFDEYSGDFTLEMNNASLTDNIIVEIPVNMTYAFQGDAVNTTTIKVKFEREEKSEVIIPEPGQWSFESPDFWGDVRTILYLFDNCGIVRSIEDEYINNLGISEDTLREWGWNGEWGEIVTRIKDFSVTPHTSTSGVITGICVISTPWWGESEESFEIQYSNCTGNSMDIMCEKLCIGKRDDSNTLQPVTATKLEEKVMTVELNPNKPASGQWAIFTESGDDTGLLLDLGVDSNGAAIAQSFESQGLSEEELVEFFGWNGEWGNKILEFTEYRVDPETKTSGTIYLTASGNDLWDEPTEEIIEIHYTNSINAQTMNISSDWFGFDNYQALLYGNKEQPLELMTINNGMEPLGVR